MASFESFRPAIERAHTATRRLIPNTGCQLGASLLALELVRAEMDANYVRGRYSANPSQDHWWVEVAELLLDPTRDQFGEDPLCETYAGQYISESRKTGVLIENEVCAQLRVQWSYNRRLRHVVREISGQYGVDRQRVEQFVLLDAS